jgi:hypothetical protein
MKVSDKPTGHILVRAHSNSEWDSCEFAIVSISEKWKEEQLKRLEFIKPFVEDYVFQSLSFYDYSVDFYQTGEDGLPDLDELLAGKDWTFIELDEEEPDNLTPPESSLDCYRLAIYRDGDAQYKAYGKYTGEEFWTENLPLKQLTSII